ncbi:hypothetical protein PR048_013510 [Dryococelus australis]|uniref:Uncharacterized protein n=1 Tax=Dryococelus australis TaxID=614101 RepID=A0ABQ9HSD2_9NEOP|nr:hypothetical protein PR048_013510 [Dryococelus australis]
MDGPNDHVLREHNKTVLNIDSCDLHVVHNAFKTGYSATGWDIYEFRGCLYIHFRDALARREDYQSTTGSRDFPLKFVSYRWLENVPVAEKALGVIPKLKCFVENRKNDQDGEEIENLKNFKQIEKEIASLTWSAHELAQKANDHGEMTLIASSNALRRTAKEKTSQLDNLKNAITSLECP